VDLFLGPFRARHLGRGTGSQGNAIRAGWREPMLATLAMWAMLPVSLYPHSDRPRGRIQIKSVRALLLGRSFSAEENWHAIRCDSRVSIAVRLESLIYVEAASYRLQCGLLRLGNHHSHAQRERASPAGKRVGFQAGFHAWFCIAVRLKARPTLPHSTFITRLSEWLLNSGAYMHWMLAKPVWYLPLSCTRTEYSKTYVPFGR